MPYDRDVVVSCIERHYDLLVRMAYLDPDTILRPPPEGWSDEQLAVDTLQEWKRSDRVIDLLRHLPYLSKNMGDSKYEVYIVTEACNYLRNHGWLKDADKKKAIRRMSPCGEGQKIPAGMIPLSQGNEATVWMIDTDQGMSRIQRASPDIDRFH